MVATNVSTYRWQRHLSSPHLSPPVGGAAEGPTRTPPGPPFFQLNNNFGSNFHTVVSDLQAFVQSENDTWGALGLPVATEINDQLLQTGNPHPP